MPKQTPMLALTLRHPWVAAITDWSKRIENRTWRPYHAGFWLGLHGGVPPKGKLRNEASADLQTLIRRGLAPAINLDDAIRPGMVGVVWVARVIHEDHKDEPLLKDPWFQGPCGWVLTEVVKFAEPIECRGGQKLWEVPSDVHEEMRRRFKEAKGGVGVRE